MANISRAEKMKIFNAAKAEASSPEQFIQNLATAAAGPINESIVENSVVRSIFPTQTIDTPVTYFVKKKRSGPAIIISKFGEPTTQIKRYERVQVEPYIIAHKFTLNEFDIKDALYNIVEDEVQQSAREIALKEDRELLRILDEFAPDPGTNATTVPPTIGLAPDGVTTELNTNVYVVGDNATAPDGAIAGTVRVYDLLEVSAAGAEIGYDFNTLLMGPHGYAQFASQFQFLYADRAGNDSTLRSGRIGTLLGYNIFVSRLVPRKSIYVMDPENLAVWIEREGVEVRTEQHGFLRDWTAFERACPFVKDANAYIRIVFPN